METTFPLGLLGLAGSDNQSWGHWLEGSWRAVRGAFPPGCFLHYLALAAVSLINPHPSSLHINSSLTYLSSSKWETLANPLSTAFHLDLSHSILSTNLEVIHLFIQKTCIKNQLYTRCNIYCATVILWMKKLSLTKVKWPTLGNILRKW